MRCAVLAVSLVGLSSIAGAADEPPVLRPGAEVRLTGVRAGRDRGAPDIVKDPVWYRSASAVFRTNDTRLVRRSGEPSVLVPLPGRKLTAKLAALEPEAYVVEWAGERVWVPREYVQSVEVRGGKGSHLRGAAYGLLAGAVIGVVVGATTDTESCRGLCYTSGQNAAMAVMFFAPLGAGIGALTTPGHSWQPVPRHRVGLVVAPAPRGGVAARVVVPF